MKFETYVHKIGEDSPICTRAGGVFVRTRDKTLARTFTTKIYLKEVKYRHGIWHLDLTHKPGDNCQELPPTIHRMVTHQPKDGHPPEGNILQTWNLALRLNSQNRWKMMEFDTEELTLVFNFLVPLSEGGWVEKKEN